MIHHLGVFASDFDDSRAFFGAALAALGIAPQYRAEGVVEFWREGREAPSLSLHRAGAAALAVGGTLRHAPRHWPEYRAYCAFVRDPDGNNIEAVVKEVAD